MPESVTVGSLVAGRYEIDEEIGRGGAGVVWRATDIALQQAVALKQVPFFGFADDQARQTRDRAMREARLAARLRGHPHVVTVYDVLTDSSGLWLVLEYVPSESLSRIIAERGCLEPGEAARIGAAVADALAAAHEYGIVHRDVSPGNVLISADGQVKLTDFGISRMADDPRVTQTGVVQGTVAYLAPEVANTGESTPQSDVYSLGSTVYAAVEGQPPFGITENAIKLLNVVRTGLIRPPERAGALTPMLLHVLELDPAGRPDAATVCEQFGRVATGVPAPPRPEVTVRGVRPEPSRELTYPPRTVASGGRRAPWRSPAVAWLLAGCLALVLALVLIVPTPTEPGRAEPTRVVPGDLVNGVPQLPRTAPSRVLGDDVRTISLCPLLDAGALRQFGKVSLRRGPALTGCTATIAPAGGDPVIRVGVGLQGMYGSWADVGGRRIDVGELKLFREQKVADGDCRDAVGLSDRHVFGVEAYQDAAPTVDLCRVATVASNSALVRLASRGVPRDYSVLDYRLANRNACAALGTPGLRAAGVDAGSRYRSSDRWYCGWGVRGPGAASVGLEFRLVVEPPQNDPELSSTMLAGERVFYRGRTGTYNDRACEVSVPAPGDAGPDELLWLRLDAPGEDPGLCAAALRLAGDAIRNSPGR